MKKLHYSAVCLLMASVLIINGCGSGGGGSSASSTTTVDTSTITVSGSLDTGSTSSNMLLKSSSSTTGVESSTGTSMNYMLAVSADGTFSSKTEIESDGSFEFTDLPKDVNLIFTVLNQYGMEVLEITFDTGDEAASISSDMLMGTIEVPTDG